MLKRSLIIAVLMSLVFASPVWALTNPPDSDPTIEDIHIYRHLLETDDFLLIARYNIPYSATPNATVEQAFLFRLLDTDNTTILLSNEAYPYVDNGYGQGLIAIYADASDAPTWGQGYILQITGKASEFADPASVTWNFAIPVSAYSTETTQAGNQGDLADKIIGIAQDLEVVWVVTLLDTGDAGVILSTNGQIYFENSISGLRVMAPTLFPIQIEDPDYTTENWTNAQSANYSARFTGTWWGNAVQDVADLFGMDFEFIASIPLIIGGVFCIVVGGQQNNIISGLISVLALLVYGALMGWTPLFILTIGSIFIAAYVGYIWFLKSTG